MHRYNFLNGLWFKLITLCDVEDTVYRGTPVPALIFLM